MKTVFTNRSEYLAYRAEWKATYKQLSKDIKTLVLGNKEHDRWYQIERWENYKPIYRHPVVPPIKQSLIDQREVIHTKYLAAYQASTYRGGGIRQCMAWMATTMLAELAAAKVEAQRQYLAQKLTV